MAGIFGTECEDGSSPEAILHSSDDQYIPEQRTSEPKRFKQQEMKDLIRSLSLSEGKAEFLASRLKERSLVLRAVKIFHYRIWNNALKIFFRLGGHIVLCYDINGLFNGLNQEHKPPDWRLFIDSSQRSLKAVLLLN